MKKANIRNRYNQVPHLTKNTTWVCDINTRKQHIQENQEVSPFLAGDHKAAMNRQDSTTDTKKDPKKKHRLGTVSTFLQDGLNLFHGTNLTLISDVDQDK